MEVTGGNSSTAATGGNASGGSGLGGAASGGSEATGGNQATGGTNATGGAATGGSKATGGANTGGSKATGGTIATGGAATGGAATGGAATGGAATGGAATGGAATGGAATGGTLATGGSKATGGFGFTTGGAATGGTKATGGSAATGGATSPTSAVDCNAVMPTGGTDHCGQNTRGTAGGQNWELWSNTLSSSACMTTFSTPAFSARWNNNGDFLARVGLEFGNSGKTYDQYGTIKADFVFKKSGSAGGFSYIGIYGWSTNPCVEWYIVDDRWGTMPFNAYNATQKGTVRIDDADYKLFQNRTTGTGGSRCSGVSQWDQFWSIRQTARQCGTITISEHFKAWDAAGMKMGGLLEAKILVEAGGGTGSIEFPVAKVTAN